MEEQLTNALVAAGQADKEAEKFLESLHNQDYGALVRLLGLEIANEAKPFTARQMAALYLKNMLAAQSANVQQEKHERWKAVPAEIRSTVKECLLKAMRDGKELQLPHFVAVATAEIAVIELPYREWPTMVGSLMENVTSQADVKIKIASLECLGYVCERIADVEDMIGSLPELEPQIVDSMLTTIVDAVQPERPEDVIFAALQALKNSLLFVRKNMDNKQERDFIMTAIFKACVNQQARIRALAYACLDTVCEYYYEVLQEYMSNIYERTTEAIKGDPDDDVKTQAIEVWNTLADLESTLIEEGQHCPRYVQAALKHLVPLLLVLLTQQNEDDEDDTQDLQGKAATCLEMIGSAVKGMIVPHVMPYVQEHVQSQEWRFRDAAIVAFMCILEGPASADIGLYVEQSVSVMLQAFNDANPVVRGSAVHCVSKICSNHLGTLQDAQVGTILASLDQKLNDKPSIIAASCTAIYHICNNLKRQSVPDTNILSNGLVQLIQHLLAVTDRADANEWNIRVGAMSAASAAINASAKDVENVFVELLPVVAGRLEAALAQQVVSNDDKEAKAEIIGQLAALIQTLYQRMDRTAVLPHTDRVMNLLLQSLQLRNAAEEIFMCIGSVVSNLEGEFQKYCDAFVPLLIQGLQSMELTSLCLICTGGVVDLCAGMGPLTQPYADTIMEAMFNIIRDGTVHRDVKPAVISAFGDMAMAINTAYQPYMQLTMMLLMQASQQSAPADNEDMVTFINQLRCAVLEAYNGILVGLAEGQAIEIFIPNLPNILSFLNFLSADTTKDETVLHKAVTLLGDIAHEAGARPEVKQQINQQFVGELIREAGRSENTDLQQEAQWAANMIQGAIQNA